ncbi:MAG TPA: FG-GAP repeat protein [Kofleriaceae bacterium]|jgi:hypothetical protein|nr:FG-GAP repeat protein [Kofleriaceae bacterium]
MRTLAVLALIPGGCSNLLAPPGVYPLSGTPGLLATGDFDHDGHQDVAIALTTNNKPELLRIVNGMLEVRLP